MPVILYDRDCGFCRWATAMLLRWDRAGRLRPIPLQDPEADAVLPPMDETTKMGSWHLVSDEGLAYSAGAAVPPLFRLLPGGRPLAAGAAALPGTTERLYGWVARHRDRLARIL